jgi:two-component system chemotaxis response regulator CheB
MSAAPIRVLVVDDSAFARKVLREALTADRRLVVVGIARDGLEALERISELSPDVVTLDLVMPNLDGLGVLKALPRSGGPRVIVVTTSDSTSDAALAALEAGAVDFVHKPTALATDRLFELSAELREKIVVAAGVVRRAPQPAVPVTLSAGQKRVRCLVIGTSTGGPQALSRLIPLLPAKFPVPVLVALHIPAGYTEALARRLNEVSPLTVIEATRKDIELAPGMVLIAPGGEHLGLVHHEGKLVARTTKNLPDSQFAPSVDHLFRTTAAELGAGALGVVLTGMGNDGLEGARAIRAAGGDVLVESASTCVVYGMPRAVNEAGLATEEAALHAMAERILAYV